jgi:hypothetical protein
VAFEWFLVAFDGAIALVVVAVMLVRVGRALDAPNVVISSRRVQALVVCTFVFGAAIFLLVAQSSRSPSTASGLAMTAAFGVAAIATLVAHLVLLRDAVHAAQRVARPDASTSP